MSEVVTPKPLLSGTAAIIVGAVAVAVSALVGVLPAPWGGLAGAVGVILAALAGTAAPAPGVTDGKPVLQGTALTIAGAVGTALATFWPSIPEGWPQSVALAGMAIIAWLTGTALPALGNPNAAKAKSEAEKAASLIHDKASAIGALVDEDKTPVPGSER